MRATERDGDLGSVLGRVSSILAAFGPDTAVLGVSQLARRTGLAKSTAHRLIGELVRLGMLERAGGGVRLGMRLFELGQLVPRQRALKDAALPFLEDLREATRASVHLAVLEGIEVVYLEILQVKERQLLPSRVGGRMPAHATGVGKAILAFCDPEVVKARIDAGLDRRTAYTVIMPGALLRELATIRKTGVAYDRQESAIGVVCAAAPVFGAQGRVLAALSVTGRAERLDLERMAPAVRTAALTLSRQLGGPTTSKPPGASIGTGKRPGDQRSSELSGVQPN